MLSTLFVVLVFDLAIDALMGELTAQANDTQ